MRIVTFKLEEALLEELDRKARELNITRSEAIRLAIKDFLKNPAPRTRRWRVRRVVLT